MKLQSIAPKRLVAIGIIAEDVSSVLDVKGSVLNDPVFGHQRRLVIRPRWLGVKRGGEKRANPDEIAEFDEGVSCDETHRLPFVCMIRFVVRSVFNSSEDRRPVDHYGSLRP